jgi:hypothetical protein
MCARQADLFISLHPLLTKPALNFVEGEGLGEVYLRNENIAESQKRTIALFS